MEEGRKRERERKNRVYIIQGDKKKVGGREGESEREKKKTYEK